MKSILIVIPNTGIVTTDFMSQLMTLSYGNYKITYKLPKQSLVYITREQCVYYAIENNYDYIFFLDSDQKVPNDIIIRLANYLDNGEDIATALVFTKKPPYYPCAYKESNKTEQGRLDLKYCDVDNLTNKPFYVQNCGCGCVMIKTEIFEKIKPPWFAMPFYMSGEDVSFFHIATQEFGYKILCDPSIEVGHWGNTLVDKYTYLKYKQDQEALKNGCVL